ncbi:MAG: alpha/beta hydrolase [Betaproteobacteria bacterium]|nr:alpha/beta hydrolase [Betaproteobacteria bacterium]MBV9361988.1 alpha/beta hydrolase [Betaproteobacteria bacterium]
MKVFVHGGVPGVTPYASGPHIWGKLPADSIAITVAGQTVDAMTESVRKAIEGKGKCHLVGHDLGGMLAFNVAIDAPQLVSGVTAVASVAAAPTGDGVPDVTFAHPPKPLYSRESQRWALERVSYSHHHIDDALLDACVAAAAKQRAVSHAEEFVPSLMKAKSRFYEVCRSEGIKVPCQVIWGSHDPLSTFDHGLWLFRGLAQKQRVTQFHVINRAGALPFREEPAAFRQVLEAFSDAL